MQRGPVIVTALLGCLTVLTWLTPSLVLQVVGPDVLYGTGNWGGPDDRGVYAVHPDGTRQSTRIRLMLSGSFAAFGMASLLWILRHPRDDHRHHS